jgi:hypothetical protein
MKKFSIKYGIWFYPLMFFLGVIVYIINLVFSSLQIVNLAVSSALAILSVADIICCLIFPRLFIDDCNDKNNQDTSIIQ